MANVKKVRGRPPRRSNGWPENGPELLKAAIRTKEHTYVEAATELSHQSGLDVAPHLVENLIRGLTSAPPSNLRPFFLEYIEQEGSPSVETGDSSAAPQEPIGIATVADRLFDQVADQPLLGSEQTKLIHAIADRISNGPPMSDADLHAIDRAAKWLGLPQ